MARILFVMNHFPGFGGVESVTANLVGVLGKDHDIYILARERKCDGKIPAGLKGLVYLPGTGLENDIRKYNETISLYHITHTINQGMYPELTDIILNTARDRSVKVFSVLHAMPGYIKDEYWYLPHVAESGIFKKLKRRLLYLVGLNKGYNRHVRSYIKSYLACVAEGDKVIMLCDDYIGEFCSIYNIPDSYRGKMAAIPNPLPSAYSESGIPDFAAKKDVILFVGRLSAEKNIGMILDAWKLLHDKLQKWELKIVGDGPMRDVLERKAAGMNLRNVIFTGFTDNPEKFYSEAKMLLLVSMYEGFPMSLIEAQRFGTVPVAYPASAGVASIIRDGGGVPVRKRNAESLAEEILELAADPHMQEDLCSSVYRKSREYDITAIAEKWNSLL